MESNEKDIIIQGYEVRIKQETLISTKYENIARLCARVLSEHIEGGNEIELVTVASLVQKNQE